VWTIGLIAIVVVLALVAGLLGTVYLLIGLAVVLVVALSMRVARRTSSPTSPSHGPRASTDFERLVGLCYNDRAMAERLVDAEARRLQGASEREKVKRAIERLIEDRRR